MAANTKIIIGKRGTKGLSFTDVLGAPKVHKKIDVNSTIEFIGKNHNLATYNIGIAPESGPIPILDAFDNNMLVTGADNTDEENTPSYFGNSITILGNLIIKPINQNAAVLPKVRVDNVNVTVTVKKGVYNDAVLENNGVIEVGECEEQP